MIFKVPQHVKGSFVLSSLNKACWANMQIAITGNALYAPDVKAAVKKGILVPFIEGEYDGLEEIPNKVIIVNKTNGNLVLEDIVLKPGKSAIISRDKAELGRFQAAEADGLIDIVTESASLSPSPKNKTISKKKKEKVEGDGEEEAVKNVEYIEPINGEKEESKVIAKVWDFQKKEVEEAIMVNKVSDIVELDLENEKDSEKNVKMIDGDKEADIITPIEKKISTKNKTTKKAADRISKKKGKSVKSKKVKEIKPVGEIREAPDVAIPLDSRGNPLGEKPSDVLKSLIDTNVPDDVSFADKEQETEKKRQRQLDNNWDWEDL